MTAYGARRAGRVAVALTAFTLPTTLFTAVQNTARNAGAIGIFYWEPTWYAVPGNGWDPADIDNSGDDWENRAVFDRTGRLNPNLRWTA